MDRFPRCELSVYKFGQLSDFKTRKNQTKRLHYDARGREDYHTWDAGAAPRIDRIWDDAGRLMKIWNDVSTIEYTYDEGGQVETESTTVAGGGPRQEVRYCRYPSGDVSRITYPNGTMVDRVYTARGQLAGVGWGGGMSTSYAYLRDGTVDYQAWTNHLWTKYEYDGRGLISSVLHRNTDTTHDLARRDYWRDDRDRILALTKAEGTSSGSGNNVEVNLHVNWYWDPKYAGTDVVTRELQHIQAFRTYGKGVGNGDVRASQAELGSNFKGMVSGFSTKQWLLYDQPKGSHNLKEFPPVPAAVPEFDETH